MGGRNPGADEARNFRRFYRAGCLLDDATVQESLTSENEEMRKARTTYMVCMVRRAPGKIGD